MPCGTASWPPGPGSTTRPGTCPVRRRPTPADRTGRWPSTSGISPTGRSSPSITWRPRSTTGRWPSDDDYDGGDFDRYNERRRAPWTTMAPDAIVARMAVARPRLIAAVRPLPGEVVRERRRVGLGLLDPSRSLPRPPGGHRAVDRDPACPPDRRRPVRRRPACRRSRRRSSPRARPSTPSSMRSSEHFPLTVGPRSRSRPAGPFATMSPTSPIGRRGRAGDRRVPRARASGCPTRTRASTPGTSARGRCPVRFAGRDAGPLRRRSGSARRLRGLVERGGSALARRLELGLRLPPRSRPEAPGDARPTV